MEVIIAINISDWTSKKKVETLTVKLRSNEYKSKTVSFDSIWCVMASVNNGNVLASEQLQNNSEWLRSLLLPSSHYK